MNLKKAFTLVEILVVATIIMLLASIGFVSYSSLSKQSRDSRRVADLQNLRSALEFYRSDAGSYPCCTIESLDQLVPSGYINKIPEDPKSDNPSYCYSSTGFNYELCAKLEDGTANKSCCSEFDTYNFKMTPLGEE